MKVAVVFAGVIGDMCLDWRQVEDEFDEFDAEFVADFIQDYVCDKPENSMNDIRCAIIDVAELTDSEDVFAALDQHLARELADTIAQKKALLDSLNAVVLDTSAQLVADVEKVYGKREDWEVEALSEIINMLPNCPYKRELEDYWDSI